MKRIVLLLTVFLGFLFKGTAQFPDFIQRNTINQVPPKTDSARNYIKLNPGFEWNAADNNTYYSTELANDNLVLDWPKEGQIIQRDNANLAWLYVHGHANSTINSVKITATPINGGTYATKTITVSSNGDFEGAIQLQGGDYQVEVREFMANGVVKTNPDIVLKQNVGVGEVLLVWGHSFMEGPDYQKNATDTRSRTVKTIRTEPESIYNKYFNYVDYLPYDFETINTESVGPFGDHSWIWGSFADTLVNRLDVPVLILSGAFGGSNLKQNRNIIDNVPFGYTWFDNGAYQNNGFPFKAVSASFDRYLKHTGIRAVLVAHGVNDSNYSSNNQLYDNYLYVINHIRNNVASFSQLTFLLGFEDLNFPTINNQIQALVDNDTHLWPGIDLRNTATRGSWRDDGYGSPGSGHFHGMDGHDKYLEFWKNTITSSLFTATTPKLSEIDNALKVP